MPGLADIAAEVVQRGVAESVAVGCARKVGGRWKMATGGDVGRLFDLASLTKPMCAVAAVRSDFPLDAPLGASLAELGAERAGRLPTDLVLAHRAGFAANFPLFIQGTHQAAADVCLLGGCLRSECGENVPDEGYPPVYSDVGYMLAGLALARHLGAGDAGEVIEQQVVAPFGLTCDLGTARALRGVTKFDERVLPTEVVDWRGGVVRGVVHDENAWYLTGDGGSGHAGMFGTVEAVLAFAAHVFDHQERYGRLLRVRPGGTLRAGFDGKSLVNSSAGERMGPRAFGHLGFTGTSFWVDPDAATIVSLLTNRVHPTRENQRIRDARPWTHDALFEAAQALG